MLTVAANTVCRRFAARVVESTMASRTTVHIRSRVIMEMVMIKLGS